jgi:hypothetical protein
MSESNRRLYRRTDLAAERRQLEMLRLENLQLKRELNMLDVPIMDKPKYKGQGTPKVFPDRPARKKAEATRVEYVYAGGFMPGFIAGLLVGVVMTGVVAAIVAIIQQGGF